jgi:hypothetical protein
MARRRTGTGSGVAPRRVIDHFPSGRAIRVAQARTRPTDATTRTRMAANNRRDVRSPELSRERAAEATSALTRPTTASAVLARDTTRPTRESPRGAGYGRATVGITVE